MSHAAGLPIRSASGAEAPAEVRAIVADALSASAVTVWLFGSWARGEQVRGSDIDIAISAREPLPVGLLALLRQRLENSTVPNRVDVVDLSTASPALREAVAREGALWISP